MKLRLVWPLLLAVTCSACVTHIRPTLASNPAPAEALQAFQHFQLMPLSVAPQAADQTTAVSKISGNIQQQLSTAIAPWESRQAGGRTLKIEPHIDQLKFVSGGKRFFAGAMAGSSAVDMHVRLVDADTGTVIADPEFYQRAAASGGAWSIGGTDNGMLARIATVARQYLTRNYDHAVGGPTGLDGTEPQ